MWRVYRGAENSDQGRLSVLAGASLCRERHMGIWGSGIFEDGRALDARDEWVQLLKDGISPEATARVWETNSVDNPFVNLAFAATQWEWGRVDERVTGEALRVLRHGRALEGWDDDMRRKRQVDAAA
jgi:hypothetical protein